MIHNKTVTYILDGISGLYFLNGIVTGQVIVMILGGLAALLSAVNHYQQIKERKKKK